MTIALALVLLGALLVYGGVTGKSVKHLLLGDNTVPSTPPSGSGRSNGSGTTTLTTAGGNYKGFIHELFYDPLDIAFDEGNWIGNIGGHSDHVHVSFADPNAALDIIAYAKRLGLTVSNNPYTGDSPDAGDHADSSYHYQNFPGSFNGKTLGMGLDAFGTKSAMDQFANWVKQTYTRKEIVTHR